jgi:mannose-6-phosphate isomerase-like protein (cupin superfamily)
MLNQVVSSDAMTRVAKGWGYEYWIHNDKDYCGKELVLYRGKKCSVHYHKLKRETFYVVTGSMDVELYDRPFHVAWSSARVVNHDLLRTVDKLRKTRQLKTATVRMEAGDSLVIDQRTPHRFRGVADETRFMEFSTQHFDADSYRIWPGDSQAWNS